MQLGFNNFFFLTFIKLYRSNYSSFSSSQIPSISQVPSCPRGVKRLLVPKAAQTELRPPTGGITGASFLALDWVCRLVVLELLFGFLKVQLETHLGFLHDIIHHLQLY